MLDDWNTLDQAKYAIVEPTLWKNSAVKFIGLDHEILLSASNATGTNVSEYYGTATQTPALTDPPTPSPTPQSTPLPTAEMTPDSTAVPGTERGDVNGDGNIDIIDALLTAQFYVGLDPAGFNPDAGDANCDTLIDIIDALLIAQYYVGLVISFC